MIIDVSSKEKRKERKTPLKRKKRKSFLLL
jgi:hypothetical protein